MFSIEDGYITITKGDTVVITLNLDNYKLAPGDTVTMTVKRNVNNPDFVIQKIVTEFEDGKAKIVLLEEDTNITPGKYKYDVQLDLADGRIDTVITPSVFKIEKGVTD